jgi:sialic acid synthase SpsE
MAQSLANRKPTRNAPTKPMLAPPPPKALDTGAPFAPATKEAPAKVCVVAEIGVNHDGRLDRAIELVDAAARAGADAVKTQLFDPRHLLSNLALLAEYQQGNTGSPRADAEGSAFAMLDRLKLGLDDLLAVRAAAHRAGLLFIVTPFSLEDFDALQRLSPDAVKIASPDAVNYPLLRLAATLGRPMIISTGTAELEELRFAAELFRGRSLHRPGPTLGCLMQCVSSYPAAAEDAGLGALPVLAKRYGLPVGYSDHTTEPLAGALAVAAGACVIEKHLTYDRAAAGPDHAASFEPDEFARYVKLIRHAAAMHGPLAKGFRDAEADVRRVSRQSVCFRRDLPQGHVITRGDLTVKRPGTGIPAAQLEQVLGRQLARAVSANNLATDEDLA